MIALYSYLTSYTKYLFLYHQTLQHHHLKEHQTFYETLHKTGRDSILRAAIRAKIGLTDDLSNEDAYKKVFFADGISGWVEEWTDRGMPESPKKLNQQLGQYFTQVLPILSKLYTH